MFLEEVVMVKREEIDRRKGLLNSKEMKNRISGLPPPRDFLGAIFKGEPLALIAEVKQASPSAGVIREGADIRKIAREYQNGGAHAISVLTEAHFFRGALAHLKMVKEAVSLPLLQKDFVIDPFQVYEGRVMGADAILLIAAILGRDQLGELTELSSSLGLVPLVEVHNEGDWDRISGLPLPLIGINNRDLNTMGVNLDTTLRLLGKIPSGTTVISESGIQTRQDVWRLREAGVAGILVGEILMRSPNPAAKIRELLDSGYPRSPSPCPLPPLGGRGKR
jgi:indole-3-glycerol phosphate synthase